MSRTTCVTLRPTLEEFRDFDGLLERAERESNGRGIVKITPPDGWFEGAAAVAAELMGAPRPEDTTAAEAAAADRAAQRLARTDVRPMRQCVSNPTGAKGAFDVALIPQPKTSVAGFRAWARRREADDARRAAEQRARFERRGVRARGRGDDDAAVPDDFPDAADVARRAADFWRTIGPNEGQPAPEYGADVDASIFAGEDESAGSGWNLHGMPSCRLRPFLARLGASMPGVNRGMLYFGAPRAFFAWHVEDANLYSINYLHCGAPKSWYALSPERSRDFERLAGDHFPGERNKCADFLRHKNTFLTPHLVAAASGLLQYEGDMVECVQRAGDMVITFPDAYHCGFNHGFNAAESTNFATDRWAAVGRKATSCECQPDTVHINVPLFEDWQRRGDEALVVVEEPEEGGGETPPRSPKRPRVEGTPRRAPATGVQRRPRCKECAGCRALDCGACKYCLDKPKNGGQNKLKKPCVGRVCTAIAAGA